MGLGPKMKIGMNLFLWCDRLRSELLPLLPALKAAGFDGVEIPAGDYSAAEIKEIRAVLDDESFLQTVGEDAQQAGAHQREPPRHTGYR